MFRSLSCLIVGQVLAKKPDVSLLRRHLGTSSLFHSKIARRASGFPKKISRVSQRTSGRRLEPKKSAQRSAESPRELLAKGLADKIKIGAKAVSNFNFNYMPKEQESNIARLVDQLIDTFSIKSADKQLVHGALFYGMAGSGKSRMGIELPALMKKCASERNAQNLVRALQRPKVIVIDWQNGVSYEKETEKFWTPEVVFGLRIAAKYWFPEYSFRTIRNVVSLMSRTEQQQFGFQNVMEEIVKDNNSKPADEQYSMLYVVNDECQTLRKYTTIGENPEPMIRAIARQFGEVCRDWHQKFFIFGSFVGLGFTQSDIFVHPTHGLYPGYCIRRLSIDTMATIVETELGQKWAKVSDLRRLLTAFGGNPRVLEVFVTKVAPKYTPDGFDIGQAKEDVTVAVLNRYTIPNSPMEWPALLSFAGYSVAKRSVTIIRDLSTKKTWTAGKVEALGFFSLRAPSSGEIWAKERQPTPPMVLDTPLMIANLAISDSEHPPIRIGKRKEVSGNTVDKLTSQYQAITNKFYTDAYAFEELAVSQFVFRWNMFNFAAKIPYVRAKSLFYGGHYTSTFAELMFALEQDVISVCSSKPQGNWAQTAENATDEMQSGQTIKFTDTVHRAIHFGGSNVFDGHLRLLEFNTLRPVIIWIDAKHTAAKAGPSTLGGAEVLSLKTKLEELAVALPNYEHLLLVVSNRVYHHDPQLINDKMCIIARDGLTYGLSPWFSLVAQV